MTEESTKKSRSKKFPIQPPEFEIPNHLSIQMLERAARLRAAHAFPAASRSGPSPLSSSGCGPLVSSAASTSTVTHNADRRLAGDWLCLHPGCVANNFQARTACFKCGAPKGSMPEPNGLSPLVIARTPLSAVPIHSDLLSGRAWECERQGARGSCGALNWSKNIVCYKKECSGPRPIAIDPSASQGQRARE